MRALIIENVTDQATLWRLVLERRGCTVVEAGNVKDAEAALTCGAPFDVILSDLQLADDTALGILDYARIKYPRAIIVLVTGTRDYTSGELHALVPSADWVLRKPVPIGDLEAVLDYLHRKPAAAPEVAHRVAS